jgi:excisionase family DNA binding protein
MEQTKEKQPVDLNSRIAFDVEEATQVTPFGRSHIYNEIRRGRLRAVKSGGRTLILKSDLEQYMASLPPMKSQGAA